LTVAAEGTRLDLSDIQGDILRAYGNAYMRTSYVFVRIADAARGREWLGGLVDSVRSAEPWEGDKPDTHLNLALTYAGLAQLGVPEGLLATFSEEFRQGMAARSELLGDAGASGPDKWDPGFGRGEPLVLATLNAKTPELLEQQLADLRARVEESGAGSIAHEQHAQVLESAREHFGYADGFAQPAIEGSSEEAAAGGGVPEAGGRWRPLAAGEFILGYPDEDTRDDPEKRLPRAPDAPLGRSGTYMVWRKLRQDVALFRNTLREAARLYEGGDEEKLAAKVAGRWRDGTPLELSPEATGPSYSPASPNTNDFRYADDGNGFRCPLGAHIRRANPRDALGFDGMLSFRHRMIRRGMPYGPELPAGAADDGRDRGLVFVCFHASIARQFEGVQVQWMNDGNIFHLGHDKDFLLGDAVGTGKMTVEGTPPFFLSPQRSFVTTRGGEYLFVPGIAALRALADGVAA
jgi:Dyp-type peroxidase family